MLDAAAKGAIVVADCDRRGVARQTPSSAKERPGRPRQAAIAPTDEGVHLGSGAEQVEIDVADPGEREGYRDVRIEQRSGHRGGDMIAAAGRRPARLAAGTRLLRNKKLVSLRRIEQEHRVGAMRRLQAQSVIGGVDFVRVERHRPVNRR